MLKKIIGIIILTITSYAACKTGYIEKDAIVQYSNGKPVNFYCSPEKPSDEKKCIVESFLYTDSTGQTKCVYYELPIEENTEYNRKKKKLKYLSGQTEDKVISMEYNNKKYTKEKINKALLKDELPSDSFLNYLPGYFDKEFLDDIKKKLESPVSVKSNFSTMLEEDKGICGKCKNTPYPKIKFPNIMKMLQNEIKELQENIKKQVVEQLEELQSTIYDLTSDEAVVYYFISTISSIAASASCHYKANLITKKPDLAKLSMPIFMAVGVQGTAEKLDTPSKTKQVSKSKSKNCVVSMNNKCLTGNVPSGVEFGARTKKVKQGTATKATEKKVNIELYKSIYYKKCMKTEPKKIQEKIINMLSNLVNGVNIDLFAIKRCTDEHAKRKWLGIYADDKKTVNNILQKILNFSISYVDAQRMKAIGYLNEANEYVKNLVNVDENSTKKQGTKKITFNIEMLKDRLNKYRYISAYIKQRLSKQYYDNTTLKFIDIISKDMTILYYNYNLLVNKIKLLTKSLDKNKKISKEEYDYLLNYIDKELDEYIKYRTNLLLSLSKDKDDNQFFRSIGCVEYNDDTSCKKIGLRLILFKDISNYFYRFKRTFFDSKYPVFKDKSYSTIENYIIENVLDNGNIENVDSVDKLKLYIDYLILQTYLKDIKAIQKITLDISKYSGDLTLEQQKTIIKLIKKIFYIAEH